MSGFADRPVSRAFSSRSCWISTRSAACSAASGSMTFSNWITARAQQPLRSGGGLRRGGRPMRHRQETTRAAGPQAPEYGWGVRIIRTPHPYSGTTASGAIRAPWPGQRRPQGMRRADGAAHPPGKARWRATSGGKRSRQRHHAAADSSPHAATSAAWANTASTGTISSGRAAKPCTMLVTAPASSSGN
jgi:hypothetical protein